MPIDSSWIFLRNGVKLTQIAVDAKPVAAVIVAGTIKNGTKTYTLYAIHS